MVEPSNPLSTTIENPEPSSLAAAEEEEEAEVNAPGKKLLALRWTESALPMLLTNTQMPAEYGAMYPQEGDTAGDAPAGYVTMFADFFGDCNLRLPLTVFMVEVLEYYKLHISQLSPLGMIRVRNFESTFLGLGIEPIVGDFRRFYQLSVQLGFFSFHKRDHAPKLMLPPKGMTKWKTNFFFYVKAVAITAKLQFRIVTGMIITENISVPKANMVDWFPWLRIIGWFKLDNRQLWVLRMMIGRLSRKARPVLREKNSGHLGALGDPAATGVPKEVVLKFGDKRQRKKKTHEVVSVPSLVPEVAVILHIRLRKYEDYVVVSDTLEGLGVPGGSAAVGGSTTGTKPIDVKKRKGDAPVAGGEKAPKLRKTRTTAVPKPKTAVSTEPLKEPVSLFATPPSSPKVVQVEVQKKDGENPSIEVVSGGCTPPSVHAAEALKKTAGEAIVDMLDSSNNLIYP
ncbi:hypothetical protein Hdeb2414_s0004g00133271 [Helianthus debilis subsp. tardiflorus]